MTNSNNLSKDTELSIDLLQYLKETIKLKQKSVRDISNYENKVFISDIPESKNCFVQDFIKKSVNENEEEFDDKWVEIKKPKINFAPKVPTKLENWIDTKNINDPFINPVLLDVIEVPSENQQSEYDVKIKKLSENNYIKNLFDDYLKNKWIPWSKIEKINWNVQKVYEELYNIYSNQKKLNETYEIYLGFGYLTWKTPSGYEVRRHCIASNISIEFDAKRGVITVRPSGINGFTYFEQDMLDHSEQIHGNEEEEIKKTVSELRYNVWGSNKVHNALSSIINYLSSNGKYLKNIERQKEVKSEPIVSFAPAIILRKRGHRNFIDFIDKSQINLREKNNIPSLVKKLISSQSKIYEENNNTNEKIVDKTQNIYFPLPANDQQREILDVLNKKDGILVEGPPGTGKSHTIANLTTHLLAIGKRVLITSNGVRALKVLKDKFPKEIQSLCINVLGDDTKANQTLRESVEDINNRNTEWKEENELKQIDEYYNNLNSQNKKEGSIIKDIIAVREQETHKYNNKFKYYSGTLSNIAKQIAEETDKYNWITQDEYIEDQCPINEVQLNELHQLINTYSDEKRKDLKKFIFSPNNLWSVEEFKAHLEKRNKNYEDKNENKNKIKINFNLDFLKNLNDAELFLNDIKSIKNILDTIHTDSSSWIANVLNDIFMKKDNIWKKLLDNSNKDLLKTKTLFKEIEDKNISGLDNNDLLKIQSDIETLLVHLKSGKGFGFSVFRNKIIKNTEYLWKNVKINGNEIKNIENILILQKYISSQILLKNIKSSWSFTQTSFLNDDLLALSQVEDLISKLSQIISFNSMYHNLISKIDSKNSEIAIKINNEENIEQLLFNILNFIYEIKINNHNEIFKEYLNLLSNIFDKEKDHNINNLTFQSIINNNVLDYEKNYNHLLLLHKEKKDVDVLSNHLKLLKKAMPNQYFHYCNSFNDPVWSERFKFFSKAWYFSNAKLWIERLTDPDAYDLLEKNHKDIIEHKFNIIDKLASKKSWANFFGPNGIQPQQMESLKAWAKLITALGKGKGKHAARKTKAAKDKMKEMQESIPCWVMPLYRVVENFTPGKHLFDVAIIDEASQSGPEALILFFLAKKIVIVGDDKQIAPLNIRTDENSLVEFGNKYLKNIPNNELFANRETSFFDIGDVKFGNRIRLREHFRCVPEIIEYCNKRFYNGQKLIPLRQFGSDRLKPIKPIYVNNGFTEGEGQNIKNEEEANQIVNTIKNCIDDERYKNKKFGVISLRGSTQAKIIEQKLISLIGAEKYEEHDIRCGDASHFQGDERNVIFLSMVVAPNQRFATLSQEMYKRSFNVAVSRAQDQLWVFHSVDMNDLNNNCERTHLLNHCLNPELNEEEIDNKIVPIDERVEPFDSLFEQRVYNKIVERGYKVIPQYETYNRKIDLVIQGDKEKLAVECDGDEVHGPEQYQDDVDRQRDLERCGWVFWRIRSSSFYIDKDKSLETLWRMLEERGIYPKINIKKVINIEEETKDVA